MLNYRKHLRAVENIPLTSYVRGWKHLGLVKDMIYLTQLIFIKKEKKQIFQQFENIVIPLMEKHKGKILYRL